MSTVTIPDTLDRHLALAANPDTVPSCLKMPSLAFKRSLPESSNTGNNAQQFILATQDVCNNIMVREKSKALNAFRSLMKSNVMRWANANPTHPVTVALAAMFAEFNCIGYHSEDMTKAVIGKDTPAAYLRKSRTEGFRTLATFAASVAERGSGVIIGEYSNNQEPYVYDKASALYDAAHEAWSDSTLEYNPFDGFGSTKESTNLATVLSNEDTIGTFLFSLIDELENTDLRILAEEVAKKDYLTVRDRTRVVKLLGENPEDYTIE